MPIMDVKFVKVKSTGISGVPITDGQIIVATDSAHVWYDMGGVRRRAVTISDNYTTSAGSASGGVVASSKAVADCYSALSALISNISNKFNTCSSGSSYASSFTTSAFSDGMYIMAIIDSDTTTVRSIPSLAVAYFSGSNGWINFIKSSDTKITGVTYVNSGGHKLKVTASSNKYISVFAMQLGS